MRSVLTKNWFWVNKLLWQKRAFEFEAGRFSARPTSNYISNIEYSQPWISNTMLQQSSKFQFSLKVQLLSIQLSKESTVHEYDSKWIVKLKGLLCISTSFRVLRAPESWSNYLFFSCFQAFLTLLRNSLRMLQVARVIQRLTKQTGLVTTLPEWSCQEFKTAKNIYNGFRVRKLPKAGRNTQCTRNIPRYILFFRSTARLTQNICCRAKKRLDIQGWVDEFHLFIILCFYVCLVLPKFNKFSLFTFFS